jgi:hypothetical protein
MQAALEEFYPPFIVPVERMRFHMVQQSNRPFLALSLKPNELVKYPQQMLAVLRSA